MSFNRLNTNQPRGPGGDNNSLLSPVAYDDDASSIHSRSDQDTDSDDDQLQQRARNSRELRAADRIVLMEEEELDKLVTSSRREKERQRRGSGLSVPNPLKMLGRRLSSSQLSSPNASTENLVSEKRAARRSRRKQKKNRLLDKAKHGEDGELMYEMEEGGLKDGSSTGDSSDREDSEETDRRRLNIMTQAKADRGRRWRRWIFLHTLIAIGFAILVLIAWKLSRNRKSGISKHALLSNGTALFAPTTIILSLDGFRADFLNRGLSPRLNMLIKEGVSPLYMNPSFPSLTFPNHYTLATGLYPEAHGIVGNSFWDPDLEAEFYYTDPARSLDAKWWGGEPFWVTAENQGIRTAVHMWPGSEAHILGVDASIVDKYNGKEPLDNKVSRVLGLLDMPGKEDPKVAVQDSRPQLIAAYVPNVDSDGHRYGPNSTEIRTTIQDVDNMLDKLFAGLEQRNLTNIVNIIVVSDHGMATTDTTRLLQLEDLVDPSKIDHIDGWPLYGLRPKDDKDTQGLYEDLKKKAESNPNFDVYLRDVDMPKRYHFSNHHRIAPLWIVPKTGWAIVHKDELVVEEAKKKGEVYHPRGLHGYDNEHPLMRAIFIARGPAFPHPANSKVEPFQNTEVYNILCDSIGMKPKPNNGTIRLPFKTVGNHDTGEKIEEPEDPPPASTAAAPQSTHFVHPIRPSPIPSAHPTGHERPTVPKPSTTGEPSNDGNGGDGGGSGSLKDKVSDTVKGVWDWLTDKVGGIWDKITGSNKES